MILTRDEQIPDDALTPDKYATHILRSLGVPKPSPALCKFTTVAVWITAVAILITVMVVGRAAWALTLGTILAAETLYRAWSHIHPHVSPVVDQLAQGQRVKETRAALNLT